MIDNHCTLEKTQAKVAKTINWKVVDNWREKLGAESNLEMMIMMM